MSSVVNASDPTKKLSDEEKRKFDKERVGFFKGTIAVMVIYAAIILLMSIIGFISERGRNILFINGFMFSVTFMAGVILIVMLLMIQVLTYKLPEKVTFAGENIVCPDYWILKRTPDAELSKITNDTVRNLSKFYCERPDATLIQDVVLPAAAANEDSKVTKLRESVSQYNALSQSYHMQCNRVYPDYLAYVDKKNFPEKPTSVRCDYVDKCASSATQGTGKDRKIVWSNVCPGEI